MIAIDIRLEKENGSQVSIGTAVRQEDGYFLFSTKGDKYYSSYILRKIADELDQINKPWDDQVTKDLK